MGSGSNYIYNYKPEGKCCPIEVELVFKDDNKIKVRDVRTFRVYETTPEHFKRFSYLTKENKFRDY